MWSIMVIFIWFISILLLIIYWWWLYFMCKMFWSFSIDVYVIFLHWNISMNCTHFIFIGHLLMLTYFCMENVPEFQYCFWLFTDVDYFSYCKVYLYRLHMRILHLYTTKTLDTLWSIYCWDICTTFCYWIYVLLAQALWLWDFLLLIHTLLKYLAKCAPTLYCGVTYIAACVDASRTVFWDCSICKMFLSFLIDVYMIFLYWNISMNCKHVIFIRYSLMLTYFHV